MDRKYKAGEFSKEQYDTNDAWGIQRITKHLRDNGFTVVDKEVEDYDVDILAYKNGKEFRYEAEVKTGYPFTSVDDYNFNTVSFLGRKKKYHTRSENGFYYAIVCKETEAIVYCHSSKIYKDEYRIVRDINSTYRKGTDEFFLVPKHNCQWTILK